jgi:hypothetical protein
MNIKINIKDIVGKVGPNGIIIKKLFLILFGSSQPYKEGAKSSINKEPRISFVTSTQAIFI